MDLTLNVTCLNCFRPVPDADYFEACRLTDLMGVKAIEMLKNK